MNITRSWEKAQGITHPTDLSGQIIRDYNIRGVSIQNSSTRDVGFAVTAYGSGPTPSILKVLRGGENFHMGINAQGDGPQFIWVLDPTTAKKVSTPYILRRDAQEFVLRDGLNKWMVHAFVKPSFSG